MARKVREGREKTLYGSKGRFFPHLPGKSLILRESRTISSESRLINGLRAIFRELNFRTPFAHGRRRNGDAAVEVMRMRRIIHDGSLAQFLLFANQIVVRQKIAP
jgi:hypothetical protein